MRYVKIGIGFLGMALPIFLTKLFNEKYPNDSFTDLPLGFIILLTGFLVSFVFMGMFIIHRAFNGK